MASDDFAEGDGWGMVRGPRWEAVQRMVAEREEWVMIRGTRWDAVGGTPWDHVRGV